MKPHYTSFGKRDLEKFAQKKKKDDQKESEHEADEPKPDQAASAVLTGPFAVINPIQTCVGPIGEFQLDPDNFPRHPSVVLFGQRRTGKTFTLRHIMAACFSDIPFGIVLTRTSMNGFWQRKCFLPRTDIF